MEADQLKQFAQISQPEERETWELDVARFRQAVRDGGPVPTWGLRTRANRTRESVPLRDCHMLSRGELLKIINSPLTPEFYEAAHGVPAMIVAAVRRLLQR